MFGKGNKMGSDQTKHPPDRPVQAMLCQLSNIDLNVVLIRSFRLLMLPGAALIAGGIHVIILQHLATVKHATCNVVIDQVMTVIDQVMTVDHSCHGRVQAQQQICMGLIGASDGGMLESFISCYEKELYMDILN